MKTYLKYLGVILIVFCLFGCGGSVEDDVIKGQLVDPILTWDVVTTNCAGYPFTGLITYNVYAIVGNGPIPTIDSPDEQPCGIVQLANYPRLNTAPITTNTYQALVPDGIWTFAVEAVSPNGARSGLSNQITVTVFERPAGVINLSVGKSIAKDVRELMEDSE